MFKNAGLLALILSVLSASIQAQDRINTTRLVFDITPVTEEIMPFGSPLSESDESDENYRSALRNIVSYEAEASRIQQEDNNPFNYEFLELYTSLGDAYNELGRYEDAIAQYDDAMQIIKIQDGLYSMDQLNLIEKVVQSYITLGDLDTSTRWQEYEYFLYLHNYEPGSTELVRATNDLADWYISSFFMQNFQDGERGLDIMLNAIPSQSHDRLHPLTGEKVLTGGGPLSLREVEDARLSTVARLYEDAQQDIIVSEAPNVDSIAQIARRIAGLSYITKQEMDFENSHNAYIPDYQDSRIQEFRLSQGRLDRSFESGRTALLFIIEIMRTVDAPSRMIASALIELADWNLAYGQVQSARVIYDEAYQELISAGFSVSEIDDSLNLAIPRQIPRSATHAFTRKSSGLSRNTELEYRGFIDVSFELDNMGNPHEVVFSQNNRPESRQIEQVITDQLRNAKFRPNFRDGVLTSPGLVELRYYYSY